MDKRVQTAMQDFSPMQARVFNLVRYQGRTLTQAASELQIPRRRCRRLWTTAFLHVADAVK